MSVLAPAADVLLASGLMPYLDEPLVILVRQLRALPRYILLNKDLTRGADRRDPGDPEVGHATCRGYVGRLRSAATVTP